MDSPKYKHRDSNAELLRIICILFILMHHFCVHALYPEAYSMEMEGYAWDSRLALFMHGFLFVGVNCFILISGWYGIRTKWKSFLNLYLLYAFYNLLHPLTRIIAAYVRGDGFVLPYPVSDMIIRTLFPFSHGQLWFMDCYLALFLIAPLLNIAIEHMNKSKFAYVLGLLTVLNVYFAYFWNMDRINAYGYSVANFVYLYLIGSYMHKYIADSTFTQWRWRWLSGYIVCAIVWGGFSLINAYGEALGFYIPHWEAFSYTNPLILLSAVCFFLFMMSWHFKSSVINWLAASTLGVYLFNELVIQYSFLQPYAHRYQPLQQILLWFGVSIIFYVFAILVDKVRMLFHWPLEKALGKYIDSKI